MSTVFKCKMCGGTLNIDNNETLVTCDYCGSYQTIPFLNSDKKTRLFSRALDYRLSNDFDRAYNAYEAIVNEEPTEAEAYWGLVLSQYGVEYVEDPSNHKRIPTCHRTSLSSITSNANYKLAIENASLENKMIYEEEAKVIDRLQKEILSVSLKEEPYDVFICYKEENNGIRTVDSVLAQDIYDNLTKEGIRTFFARISLENKIGRVYEPYIFNALNTAKVMILVSSSNANCEAVWVKNEWSRYLSFIKGDNSRILIPALKDMSAYELPDELQKLQVQDMNKIGAMQDLLHGVKKIVGKSQENKQTLNSSDRKLLDELLKEKENKTKNNVILALSIAASVIFALYMFYSGDNCFELHNTYCICGVNDVNNLGYMFFLLVIIALPVNLAVSLIPRFKFSFGYYFAMIFISLFSIILLILGFTGYYSTYKTYISFSIAALILIAYIVFFKNKKLRKIAITTLLLSLALTSFAIFRSPSLGVEYDPTKNQIMITKDCMVRKFTKGEWNTDVQRKIKAGTILNYEGMDGFAYFVEKNNYARYSVARENAKIVQKN